jgi:hypothetical protein
MAAVPLQLAEASTSTALGNLDGANNARVPTSSSADVTGVIVRDAPQQQALFQSDAAESMFLQVLTDRVPDGDAKLRVSHISVDTDQDATGLGCAPHQRDDQLSVC